MGRRSARKAKNRDQDPPDALKMVLKLSAKEYADSQPASPSLSAISNDSDNDSTNRAGSKRSRKSQGQAPPAKLARKDDSAAVPPQDFAPAERNLRDRYKAPSPKPRSNALQDALLYLQKLIERRDNQRFFAFPINDMIAPDYSKVVKKPMDLSTTREKIEKRVYTNIMEFKADVKLICVNAMNYNHPDTVYYKAAQKLLEYAMRTMSKERLQSMRKNQPTMSGLLDSELALHLDVDASDYIAPSRTQKKQKDSNAYLTFEPVPDHLPAKDIVAIAKEKAAQAAEHLAKTQPHSKMGFLNIAEDGTTSLNILNPDHSGHVSDKERVITLGEKIGKLKAGRSFLESLAIDNDMTHAKPFRYLDYGPYSSGAPTHDSTYSNLTKEESDLLLSFYGTQNSLDYVQSLRTFVSDSSDSLIEMIEDLIDNKTGGKHSQAQKALNETRAKNAPAADAPAADAPAADAPAADAPAADASAADAPASIESGAAKASSKPADIDFDALKSLSDVGIDVSFLDDCKSKLQGDSQTSQGDSQTPKGEGQIPKGEGQTSQGDSQTPKGEGQTEDETQKQLDKTAGQISNLNQIQEERLSKPPNSDSSKVATEAEQEAATQVTDQLASLAKQVKPGEITDKGGVQKALGIGSVDVEGVSNAEKVDLTLDSSDKADQPMESDALKHHIGVDKSPSA